MHACMYVRTYEVSMFCVSVCADAGKAITSKASKQDAYMKVAWMCRCRHLAKTMRSSVGLPGLRTALPDFLFLLLLLHTSGAEHTHPLVLAS